MYTNYWPDVAIAVARSPLHVYDDGERFFVSDGMCNHWHLRFILTAISRLSASVSGNINVVSYSSRSYIARVYMANGRAYDGVRSAI